MSDDDVIAVLPRISGKLPEYRNTKRMLKPDPDVIKHMNSSLENETENFNTLNQVSIPTKEEKQIVPTKCSSNKTNWILWGMAILIFVLLVSVFYLMVKLNSTSKNLELEDQLRPEMDTSYYDNIQGNNSPPLRENLTRSNTNTQPAAQPSNNLHKKLVAKSELMDILQKTQNSMNPVDEDIIIPKQGFEIKPIKSEIKLSASESTLGVKKGDQPPKISSKPVLYKGQTNDKEIQQKQNFTTESEDNSMLESIYEDLENRAKDSDVD